MAHPLSAGWLERLESATSVQKAAEARRPQPAIGLRSGDAEEPAAIAVRLRTVDPRRHPSPSSGDQGTPIVPATGTRHAMSLVSAPIRVAICG
jgi:hypothetical protein